MVQVTYEPSSESVFICMKYYQRYDGIYLFLVNNYNIVYKSKALLYGN